MKRTQHIKVDESSVINEMLLLRLAVKRLMKGNSKTSYVKGSLIRPVHSIKFGYDADDFINNRITVAADQKVIKKVPRILKFVYG